MLKINYAALVTIIADESIRQQVSQLLENAPMTDSSGGMTLDWGKGAIVVCTGKCSLADEKSIRQALKSLNKNAKFSRTNDIGQRVSQYAIGRDENHWQQIHTPAQPTDEKGEKKGGKKKGKANEVADVEKPPIVT